MKQYKRIANLSFETDGKIVFSEKEAAFLERIARHTSITVAAGVMDTPLDLMEQQLKEIGWRLGIPVVEQASAESGGELTLSAEIKNILKEYRTSRSALDLFEEYGAKPSLAPRTTGPRVGV